MYIDRIKLSKGAVYWHFKSKPDMFLAVDRQMEEMEAKIENTLKSVFDKTHTLIDLKRILFKIILLIAGDEQLRIYYSIVELGLHTFFGSVQTEDELICEESLK